MAGRIKYQKVLRTLHLYASMILLAYLLMYFITAFILIRHDWFPETKPEVTTQILNWKDNPSLKDPEAIREKIAEQLEITGRKDAPVIHPDSSMVFNIYRPGLGYQITLDSAKTTLTVKRTEQQTISRISSRLHLMRHYTGGTQYIIWSVFYDLAAVSMLVFSITGILIWIKVRKKYRHGIWFMATGTFIVAGTLLYLMFF